MANFIYNEAKRRFLRGLIDMQGDIRVLLVMTNTTADTEDDVNTIGGFTTLDEFDGSGYSSGGQELDNEVVTEDAANNRAEASADNETFSTEGAGSRNAQAAIIYLFDTDLSSSIPIAYIDAGGFPFAANGGDITFQWNAEGILQAA